MHYFDNPSDETTSGSNQMQQNDQMPQIMAMLTKIFTKLEEHDLRFDVIETRLDVIEQWMVITDKRITRIEQKIDDLTQRVIALENRVAALEQRMTVMETEVLRLGALFEDNEKKLQHILDVLSSYLKKMEKVDQLDESMIEQTQGLQITKIALANHIQNRKIHLMPPRGRPKKNPDESET